MLGTLSIILFIPTAKHFQNFQNQRIDEEPSLNGARKNINSKKYTYNRELYPRETPNEITENSSLESQKQFLNQFSYYLDDPVSSSRSEVPDLAQTENKTPRTLKPGAEGSF